MIRRRPTAWRNDAGHPEVGIVAPAGCNNAVPQQSPPPESAVEIQDVIGHYAAGMAGAAEKEAQRPGCIQRNRIHGRVVTAHPTDTGLNGMAYRQCSDRAFWGTLLFLDPAAEGALNRP